MLFPESDVYPQRQNPRSGEKKRFGDFRKNGGKRGEDFAAEMFFSSWRLGSDPVLSGWI